MSATTFAGSAQFAAASVLEDGGTVVAAIVSALLLNARYVGMSVTVASIFPGGGLRRFVESQLIVDESWALSGRIGALRVADPRRRRPAPLRALGLEHAGRDARRRGSLGDPNDLGLDAAFAALFLGLALPYLKQRRALEAAGLAALITLTLIPVAPVGVPIVMAAVACLVGLRR